jgi:hypothetical protein
MHLCEQGQGETAAHMGQTPARDECQHTPDKNEQKKQTLQVIRRNTATVRWFASASCHHGGGRREDTQHVEDPVYRSDVREEGVPQALPFIGTLHQPSNVMHLQKRRHLGKGQHASGVSPTSPTLSSTEPNQANGIAERKEQKTQFLNNTCTLN